MDRDRDTDRHGAGIITTTTSTDHVDHAHSVPVPVPDHPEYGFLDLTDINEEERSSLTSALFASTNTPVSRWPNSEVSKTENQVAWTDLHYVINNGMNVSPVYILPHPHMIDLSSCSSDTAGPPTASSSLDSLSTAERDMAPTHSPQRAPSNQVPAIQGPPNNTSAIPPPAIYSQPPPPIYAAPAPHGPQHHWPHMIPPNVYVSQVTANVNVHGWGQYYQPQQYIPIQQNEQRGRDGRRGRRNGPNKRNSSPPPSAAPYVYYPTQYYPAAQTAQGAPLYQVPVYPHMGYVTGYPYAQYVEYPMMEDPNQQEKHPDEYPTEMMMDHEHVQHEIYYPHSCIPQPAIYDPSRPMDPGCPIDPYATQYYSLPPPAPVPHQFNVHAKNFIRQNEHKSNNQIPVEFKAIDNVQAKPNSTNNNVNSVEALPIAELKISSGKSSTSPNNLSDKNISPNSQPQSKAPIVINNDKIVPKPPTDTPKVAWTNNQKPIDTNVPSPATKIVENSQKMVPITTATPNVPITNLVNKPLPPLSAPSTAIPLKVNKSFAPIKTAVKTSPSGVIVSTQNLPSKAPFPNKQKKELSPKSQEGNSVETTVETNNAVITVNNSANIESKPVTPTPVIKSTPHVPFAPATASNKITFNQSRKPTIESGPKPQLAPTQPAPSASDFPPVPVPRRSIDKNAMTNSIASQPSPSVPSPIKSWASLLKENSTTTSTGSATSVPATDESSPQSTTTPTTPVVNPQINTNQKPVAKVGPFDASPLQQESLIENKTMPMSYSEKTTNLSNQNVKSVNSREMSNHKDNQSHAPPQINNPNLYRIGEYLLKYQLNHHIPSVQPRGLSNRSNYCYINSILQALLACPPFFNMLLQIPLYSKRGKSTTPVMDAMVELVNEFTLLQPGARITRAERSARASAAGSVDSGDSAPGIIVNAGPPFEPSGVLKALRDIQHGDSFRVEGRQEDAEEFLGCLLNGLNDEMLELMKLVEPEEPKENPVMQNGTCDNNVEPSDDNDDWKVMGPKNKGSIERRCLAGRTPLSDIFRGQLRSRLQRGTDTSSSDTTHCVQPFFTLPLDIERSNSVAEALERVAGRDRLEGVTCPSRGRLVEAWQQSLLEQLPTALILHLKCFHCRPGDGATAKILKSIEYPMDLKIDSKIISPKMKYNHKQKSYKLFAVVYHEGSEAEKGHYLTDVYHAGCGGWLRYDDSVVTAVTESQVLHPRLPRMPYLLLYRRQDTIQGQRFQQNNS